MREQRDHRAERPVTPRQPRRLGDYLLSELLGKGASASVYRAHHVRSGLPVAVKIIAPHLARNPTITARFEAEARVLARIDHPAVVQLYETGKLEDGTLFQVMELLRGRELAQVLRYAGTLTPEQALPYLRQICAGLQAAHDREVVHRDLKPRNIFVLDGDPLRLKLLDFGIARLLAADEARLYTAAGVTIGTPRFMAPEQARGDREQISPRTDLYSLGVLLYLMLSGTTPFTGSFDALVLSHTSAPLPPLRERAPQVQVAVAEVVHRCLEKDPQDRPASAAALLALYEEALESATVVDVTSPWFAAEPEFVTDPAFVGDPGYHARQPAKDPPDELFSAPTRVERVLEPQSTERIRTGTSWSTVAVISLCLLLAALVLIYLLF